MIPLLTQLVPLAPLLQGLGTFMVGVGALVGAYNTIKVKNKINAIAPKIDAIAPKIDETSGATLSKLGELHETLNGVSLEHHVVIAHKKKRIVKVRKRVKK